MEGIRQFGAGKKQNKERKPLKNNEKLKESTK
jgi:hypothetical protein